MSEKQKDILAGIIKMIIFAGFAFGATILIKGQYDAYQQDQHDAFFKAQSSAQYTGQATFIYLGDTYDTKTGNKVSQ